LLGKGPGKSNALSPYSIDTKDIVGRLNFTMKRVSRNSMSTVRQ
jgi:hypothetical protein